MSTTTLTVRAKVEDDGNLTKPPKVGFLQLPRNVRDQIYELALVESTLWDRKHELLCYIKTCDPTESEPPPFLMAMVEIHEDLDDLFTFQECDCGKRKSINLLLANRQIHEEAAPIFWAQNTFCFLSGLEVSIIFNHMLRPKYVDLVRYISIMSPEFALDKTPNHVLHDVEKGTRAKSDLPWFWKTISTMKGLLNLEVPSGMFLRVGAGEGAEHAISVLPNLTIDTLDLIPIFGHVGLYPTSRDFDEHYKAFYARVLLPIVPRPIPIPHDEECEGSPKGDDEPMDAWELRAFALSHEMLAYKLEEILLVQFFGESDSQVDRVLDEKKVWFIPKGLDEDNTTDLIPLGTGEVVPVEYYGLPPSAETALRRARELKTQDEEERATDGLIEGRNDVDSAPKK